MTDIINKNMQIEQIGSEWRNPKRKYYLLRNQITTILSHDKNEATLIFLDMTEISWNFDHQTWYLCFVSTTRLEKIVTFDSPGNLNIIKT